MVELLLSLLLLLLLLFLLFLNTDRIFRLSDPKRVQLFSVVASQCIPQYVHDRVSNVSHLPAVDQRV